MTQSQELFTRFIRENKGIIYKICNSYCANRDDRDDLAQEIIYNLWKSFNTFKPEFKFSTWMYRIALNVAISFYRQEKKYNHHVSVTDGLIVFDKIPEVDLVKEENLLLLQSFIDNLKDMDKAIILLYLDSHVHKEISEITGLSESNVATRINRIKEKLRSNFSIK